MTVRDVLLGDRRPRVRVAGLAIAIPIVASLLFLLGYDAVLGFSLLYLALAIALYAGWARAGALAGLGVVFCSVLWRFVVPPLVGYLRRSMETRYTPPRMLGYKLDPYGELVEGLTHGPVYALVGAVLFGGIAYLAGAIVRRVGADGRTIEN